MLMKKSWMFCIPPLTCDGMPSRYCMTASHSRVDWSDLFLILLNPIVSQTDDFHGRRRKPEVRRIVKKCNNYNILQGVSK